MCYLLILLAYPQGSGIIDISMKLNGKWFYMCKFVNYMHENIGTREGVIL